ncbi:unnamed protein product, partial [Sphagnum compactum]
KPTEVPLLILVSTVNKKMREGELLGKQGTCKFSKNVMMVQKHPGNIQEDLRELNEVLHLTRVAMTNADIEEGSHVVREIQKMNINIIAIPNSHHVQDREEQNKILEAAHGTLLSGHPGVQKMYK